MLEGISGAGKNVLGEYLEELGIPKLTTCTTRNPRPNEIPNKSYYFKTKEEYNQFNEHNKLADDYYSGDYYWLTYDEINRHKEDIVYCILNAKGAKDISNKFGEDNVIIICIHIPLEQLKARMKQRGESEDEIKKRYENAIFTNEEQINLEIADFKIQNDNLEKSKQLLEYIVKGMKNEEEIIF